ncbi:kinesin light chain [Mycena epipterygia]|nr:kinesin light chain [Mycena epipterygia]
MGNLAFEYSELGQFRQAEELAKTVLQNHRKILGENHSSILNTMANLAVIYYHQGRWDSAEHLQVVLKKQSAALGKEHPESLGTLASLGLTVYEMGRLSEARELQERALQARRQVLGERHPDTQENARELEETVRKLQEKQKVSVE